MRYDGLIQLYFERSDALQWYWTVYIAVIGGLLAFSSIRRRPDVVTTALVTVLYIVFAYKNLAAIENVSNQRLAVLSAIKEYPDTGADGADIKRLRNALEPKLTPAQLDSVRYFHVGTDILTIAALWALEWGRRRANRQPSG